MDYGRLELRKVFVLAAIFVVFVFFSMSCVSILLPGFKWHDQQRVGQLLLIFFSLIGFASNKSQRYSNIFWFLFICIFTLGFFSCIAAEHTAWSLKEWACYGGLVVLALFVAGIPQRLQMVLSGAIVLTLILLSFQFSIAYISAYLSSIYMLDSNVLVSGFSNPRFYGQFQAIALPIAAFAVRWFWLRKSKMGALVLFSVMSVQWVVAYCLAGRGVWAGLLVAHIGLLLVTIKFWRVIAVQIAAAVVGLGLYFLLFFLIPGWFGIDVNMRDGLRSSLSGREVVWSLAWELFKNNPLLGVGPMNFSGVINPVAAHPHQFILQLLAEWGGLVAIAVMFLVFRAVKAGCRFVRSNLATEFDAALAISLISAAVLAQVDGVFVMPYTETWLAIIAGLAVSRWTQIAPVSVSVERYRVVGTLFSVLFLAIIGYTLLTDVPGLQARQEAYLDSHFTGYKPRFWLLGQIPWE